jgi:4-hydroxy-tetrahydrodipicolinate synthase
LNSEKNTLFKGIIVPLVTPFLEPNVPDVEQLRGLIDHVIEKQVDGIFILGTTGEGFDLSDSQCQQIVEETCRYTNGRTAVVVGILNTPLPEAIRLNSIATDNGADGIVLATPHFPISQDALFEYTQRFAQQCSLPVCLYNRPNHPEVVFKIKMLKKLLQLDNIISVKDSSGDKNYFSELFGLKAIRSDLTVLMGFEELLAEAIAQGADGAVTGGANLFPGLYVALYNAAVQGNTSEVQRLQHIVEAIVENIYQPDYLTGLKYALFCKKLCSPLLNDAQRIIDSEQKKRIEHFLENLYESSF